MTLTITLNLDNAAFLDGGTEEVKRILTEVCDRMPVPDVHPVNWRCDLRDINGNQCGTAQVK